MPRTPNDANRASAPLIGSTTGLSAIRARIITAMLNAAAILAAPAWLLSVAASIEGNVPWVAVADTALYAWLLAVRFSPRLSASQRAFHLVLLVHVVGAMLLLALGPMGHGVMWLMGSTIAAGALLSRAGARRALFAQVATIGAATVVFFARPSRYFDVPIPQVGWLAFAASSVMLSGALAAAIARLLAGLEEAMASLSDERARLEASHADLLAETARRALLEAQLEQRVVARTTELALANEELERFAHAVSHDLRAPLRAIDGFSSALEEDYAGVLDVRGRRHVERVRSATKRMSALIEALLALARVGRASLVRDRVDVSAIARSVAAELRTAEPERVVSFTIQSGLWADADPVLVRIVIENLLGNAWKFTSRVAEATIDVGARTDVCGTVYFVRDNGAGFDPSKADQLFREFKRLHAESDFAGTGVGLATVARVVKRHGGRVWAEGAVGHGATFFWTLGDVGTGGRA